VASKLARHSWLDRAYSPSLPLTIRQATPAAPLHLLCSPALLAVLYALFRLLIDLLILRGRPTADRDLELLVLRKELLVLRRTAPRPRRRVADRWILAALGRKLSAGALLLVQPATILGWHRALVHHRWAAFGWRGPGWAGSLDFVYPAPGHRPGGTGPLRLGALRDANDRSSLGDCLRRDCGWCFYHRTGCRHDASQSVDQFPRRKRSQLSRATSPVTTGVPLPQSLSNLALPLQELGELAAARSFFESALAICENVLGPDHPTAASRRALQSPHQASSGTPVISSSTPRHAEGHW
jgi:tetratricopeptide repeat protein